MHRVSAPEPTRSEVHDESVGRTLRTYNAISRSQNAFEEFAAYLNCQTRPTRLAMQSISKTRYFISRSRCPLHSFSLEKHSTFVHKSVIEFCNKCRVSAYAWPMALVDDRQQLIASLASTIRPSRLRLLGTLAVILLCLLPTLTINLSSRTAMHTMERLSVTSAQETWLRQHAGEKEAWLIPSLNERPRMRKPPLVVWLNMLAWSDLDPQTVSAEKMIGRARLVSVGMSIILLSSLFWIGHTLSGIRLAAMATLAAGTCWFFQREGRMASYDIHTVAWSVLAVAGGLWGIRKSPELSANVLSLQGSRNVLKPIAETYGHGSDVQVDHLSWLRLLAGMLIVIIGLAASWLSKNPLAFLFVVPALFAGWFFGPNRRWQDMVAIVVALVVAALITQPWYWYLDTHVPNAAEIRALEYRNLRHEYQGPWYYLGFLGLIAPWTLWLVAGILQPFIRATGAERKRQLISWSWFAIMLVVLAAYPAKQQRYVLCLIAPAALLIAHVFRDHQHMADVGEFDNGVRPLRNAHWIMLLIASLLFGPFLYCQQDLLELGWIDDAPFGAFSLIASLVIGIILVALAIFGWKRHRQWQPMQAGVITAVWMSVINLVIWIGYGNAPDRLDRATAMAEQVAAEVPRGSPFYHVSFGRESTSTIDDELEDEMPQRGITYEGFRFLLVQRIQPITIDELPTVIKQHDETFYLLTQRSDRIEQQLHELDAMWVMNIEDEPGKEKWLWKIIGRKGWETPFTE